VTRAVLYDTWAFVALANKADPYHAASAELDRELEAQGYVPLITDYVFDETLTFLQASAGSRVSLRFADLILARASGGNLQWIDVDAERRRSALALFRKLAPEEPRLSFTDCTSFAVMRELGVTLAFTCDRHFHRGGSGIRPLFEVRGKKLRKRPLR
jgi:predicted nucleic acid-binding protein